MRTIAVILGDNDFGNTFYPLMETIYRAVQWNDLTKYPVEQAREFLTNAIKQNIKGHYHLFQRDPGDVRWAWDSLDLEKVRILFDEEAEHDIQTADHNHGAWHLCLQTGKVYSY